MASRIWDEAKHPRGPGGRFVSAGGAAKTARAASGESKKTARGVMESTAVRAPGKPASTRALMSRADLEKKTVPQLREHAKAAGHTGHSRYRKAELVDLLAEGKRPEPKAAKKARSVMAASKGHEHIPPEQVVRPPATGRAALDAAPVKVGRLGFDRGGAAHLDHNALAEYQAAGFVDINDALRDHDLADPAVRAMVDSIDAVMAHSKLTHDIEVHRGVSDLKMFGRGNHGRSLVGMEFREPAYASTTADKDVAREFNRRYDPGHKGAVINIKVPRGTGAVQLSDLGPAAGYGKVRSVDEEAELLLQRGLRYRIVGDRTIGGVRYLDAEVVPA